MRAVMIAMALAVAACASTPEPAEPTIDELARLVTRSGGVTPALRAVDCGFIAEEGSEWACRYQERSISGAWVQLAAMVARDGDRWVLIDAVCTADEALADRGRCPR
ncbi:MAG TPA: hypothetical protein VGE54_02070 [Brevundimonas sp.]